MEPMSDLPEVVRRHLEALAGETAIQPPKAALARLEANWRAKKRLYEEQTAALAMVGSGRFEAEDPRGVLVLTRSGSLVCLGPLAAEHASRGLEYASIAIRSDVPALVQAEQATLSAAVVPGEPVRLGGCPVEATSEALEIMTFAHEVSAGEQAARLREAMIFLTNGFVRENRTLTVDAPGGIDHFTMKSIVASLAGRHGLTQQTVREIIDDYLTTIESGMLLGERVSLGRLGTLRLTVHGARKARVGRNPATGEEMLLPAKGESAAPRMSFSGRLKDRAAHVPPERIGTGDESEE